MRTLVYKRTHNGDPDKLGHFGIYNCMGRIRSLRFEAVIGIGGLGSEAESNDIAGKINWIGIGAHKTWVGNMRDPIVTFDHFLDFGTQGPDLRTEAPNLAKRMYARGARIALDFSRQEQSEIDELLALARTAPASATISITTSKRRGHRRGGFACVSTHRCR
jgi:hypothetical protein